MYQPTPQKASNTDILPEAGDGLSFRPDARTMIWNSGLEPDLNLENNSHGIEGLLSNEGLNEFTGAVLRLPCADDRSVPAPERSEVPVMNTVMAGFRSVFNKDDAH